MNDIIIGKGIKGCSATKCFEIEGEHSISENSVTFWISNLIFGLRMTIFKNTKEGIKLTKMIDDEVGISKIMDYLNFLALRKIKLTDLNIGIENIKAESYRQGKYDAKQQIRNSLGL